MNRRPKRARKPARSRSAARLPASLPAPSKPWDPTLRSYLDAARAAYLNADALAEDAALLLRGKRYARATALAITGLEETGKALMLWFVGMGLTRETHRSDVLKAVRDHHLKQATSLPLLVIGQLIPLVRRIKVRPPKGTKPPRSSPEIEALLRQLLGGLVATIEPLIDESLRDEPAITEEAVQRVLQGSLERRRQAALYTDLGETGVQSPATVRRRDAVAILRDLRACLRALKPLTSVTTFPDNGINGVLASIDMHERLWAPTSGTAPTKLPAGP